MVHLPRKSVNELSMSQRRVVFTVVYIHQDSIKKWKTALIIVENQLVKSILYWASLIATVS